MAKAKTTCPYDSMPDRAFWSRSVARPASRDLNPAVTPPFKITRADRIATAGSCFAQHIARRLKASGYNYLVSENVPATVPQHIATRYNYGVFSARFGNIYTVRQLLQLLRRARGQWEAAEPFWRDEGNWIDPFRPFIQPKGFASSEELIQDRKQHYAAVRKMFASATIFVFTLGLTEAWRSREDGAVFPGCPGCNAGEFDPEKYEFHNFDYSEILEDMRTFIAEVRQLNPQLRFVLTVSPVPLIATASQEHVLTATTYSKAVLRAVAGKLASEQEGLFYFPSYEIITSPSNRGSYYDRDLRNIAEHGVDHVMRIFLEQYCENRTVKTSESSRTVAEKEEEEFLRAATVVCDEEKLVEG